MFILSHLINWSVLYNCHNYSQQNVSRFGYFLFGAQFFKQRCMMFQDGTFYFLQFFFSFFIERVDFAKTFKCFISFPKGFSSITWYSNHPLLNNFEKSLSISIFSLFNCELVYQHFLVGFVCCLHNILVLFIKLVISSTLWLICTELLVDVTDKL